MNNLMVKDKLAKAESESKRQEMKRQTIKRPPWAKGRCKYITYQKKFAALASQNCSKSEVVEGRKTVENRKETAHYIDTRSGEK